MNELHEIHLDTALNQLKTDANNKLMNVWNEKPLKVLITITKIFLLTIYNYVINYIFINSLLIYCIYIHIHIDE